MSIPRQTLSKADRLKSHKRIRLLFAEGQKLKVQSILVYYQLQQVEVNNLFQLQMGVSVGARYFKKAVDRNLVKRRIREAYRLNNIEIKQALKQRKMGMDIFFVYTASEVLLYKQIELSVLKVLQQLTVKVDQISNS